MQLDDVDPRNIIFKRELSTSEFSTIFLVTARNQTCVMKVHRGRGPRRYYEPDRELDNHVLESTAYRRLKDQGLCDRGIVPDFLGSLRKFDPKICSPHLDMFLEDEYDPSAIFLEYIPVMEMVHLHNFTEGRMDGFIEGVREIHKAMVLHDDPRPRNMMIVRGDPERVMWMDFDRAKTYGRDSVTDEQRILLGEEEETVVGFKQCLGSDFSKGKLEEAYIFYCT
ncbi:hypothetical protein P168DRAFT_329187 [Aspergillus campestris IBT 28561]|uniref:Protein kinase domain-containing protein n=1 Tax=Aspergillus campestris (strain IBT 28561) TaxID=1392248 RepID=A0A2I1CX82_ASPC2|nr:uncharacterized protein P168DRAFT_329187 [Aspergillus campestris IBT 28561]PKY02229.1 hypothetical protein P168DRAFT_329187 [Aspergillus campestris IBT 28561]